MRLSREVVQKREALVHKFYTENKAATLANGTEFIEKATGQMMDLTRLSAIRDMALAGIELPVPAEVKVEVEAPAKPAAKPSNNGKAHAAPRNERSVQAAAKRAIALLKKAGAVEIKLTYHVPVVEMVTSTVEKTLES